MTISYGDDYKYARAKLVDTLVMYNGKPIYINHIHEDNGYVEFTCNNINRMCKLEELDLTPVQLGFVNLRSRCVYTSRVPSRHWKQGLRHANFYSEDGSVELYSPAVVQTIMGIYPSIDECEEYLINGEKESCAFSRKYCLKFIDDECLIYRIKTCVGEYSTGNISLYDEYKFFQEELEEVLNEHL